MTQPPRSRFRSREARSPEPPAPARDRTVAYEQDSLLYVCDRSDPRAWIAADESVSLAEML